MIKTYFIGAAIVAGIFAACVVAFGFWYAAAAMLASVIICGFAINAMFAMFGGGELVD